MRAWERIRLIQALELAIDYTDSLLDAYHICYSKQRSGQWKQYKKIYPYEDLEIMKQIRKWERDIKAFQRILRALKEGEDG